MAALSRLRHKKVYGIRLGAVFYSGSDEILYNTILIFQLQRT